MKVLLIWWESCNRCRFIAPYLKEWAEKNGYEFEEKDVSEATKEELQFSSSLPVIRLWEKLIDYDEMVNVLSREK